MKGRTEISGVDARIEAGRNPGIVSGVDLGPFRGNGYRDRGRKPSELLVRPDRARGASLDGARVTRGHAFERRIQHLLGLVGLSRRRGIQGRDRVPRQDIEARHRLRERLDAEQRAAREARRNARIRAADERVQAMLPEQQSARGE